MEIRVLGPIEIRAGGDVLDAGPPQQRHLLAVLAASAGRPVTAEVLIDRVWDDAPPSARRTLHVYMTRLRRLLGMACADTSAESGCLQRRSGGYLLDVDPDTVDCHRFDRLARRAREEDPASRVRLLREALDLWHGEPLAGLPGDWAQHTRQVWRHQYVDTALCWAETELLRGNPGAALGPLTGLAGEHPLMEPVAAALMRALHAAGRTAEALDCYAGIRRRLAEELGTDPGPELQRAQAAILRTEEVCVRTGPSEVLPAQLPPDVDGFAGRAEELRLLDGLADRASASRTTSVVIPIISGTAGAGKTALALHWAHREIARFPDGQLYVNLRGFGPTRRPMSPGEALRGFLEALGVAQERIPSGVDAQTALFRSVLSGRRILILLDNARDADQIRPLLPGAPGSLVLVTSRNQLTSLVATSGATSVPVGILDTAEARELLARRLGPARMAAEPAAAAEIIHRCGRLPLALAIVAARGQQTATPLAALAADLARPDGLDSLDAGDAAGRLRAVFSWSYLALTPAAARLFRLLGVHLGADLSLAAAASLSGQPEARVRALLAELIRASLVTETRTGRFAMHDLLRAYAAGLTRLADTEPQRREAVHRLLDHYLHTAYPAALLLQPARDPLDLAAPQPGVTLSPIVDRSAAEAWFAVEHATLAAAVLYAAAEGWDTHAWQVAWTLADHLGWRGLWTEWAETGEAAVAATARLGDAVVEARARRLLAGAYLALRRGEDAIGCLRRAMSLYAAAGDLVGQAHTEHNLANARGRQRQPAEALRHAQCALDLYRRVGNRPGEAGALNAIGWYHVQLGEFDAAIGPCRAALGLLADRADEPQRAATWHTLGYAHFQRGRADEAVEAYQEALALCRAHGGQVDRAQILADLGDAQETAGDAAAARASWLEALALYEDLDHSDVADLRAKLAR